MSYTTHQSTATCRLNTSDAKEAVALFVDWIGNHVDECPDSIQDLTAEELADEVAPYIEIDEDGQTIVSCNTEGDFNYNCEVFDCICHHFARIQVSDYMTVNWCSYDSRDGQSSGAWYYDKNGQQIDLSLLNNKDSGLVSCIADALWGEDAGKEWNADTINAIVDAFRRYRPDLVRS